MLLITANSETRSFIDILNNFNSQIRRM